MAFLAGLYCYYKLSSLPIQSDYSFRWGWCLPFLYPSYLNRRLGSSSSSESIRTEFPVENAYSILGVAETSSFAEIKASFRKLAKETHPDLVDSNTDPSASIRFVQIAAAYEILSDAQRRVHYDLYLLSQRKPAQKQSIKGSKLQMYESRTVANGQMEVVEWLKWYRFAINDILSEKKVIAGTGYFDVLQADFYSAIHAAFYGPFVESMDLLPDRFEAEERSVYETPEVLHLVSGRDLFGMVCLVNDSPRLPFFCNKKLTPTSNYLGTSQPIENASNSMNCDVFNEQVSELQAGKIISNESDAYRDLELHVSGRVVARATRVPPSRSYHGRDQIKDVQDHIHVFLTSDDDSLHTSKGFYNDSSKVLYKESLLDGAVETKIPLGVISGLGTTPDEGPCFVYNSNGTKTHVIMKHRTFLVKHMHWYQLGDEISVCECRSTRARLPPSKFWLFEPRCGTHDIGGWYIETFGKDKNYRTVACQRKWDGLVASEQLDKRLHPAMYLLALAYRTLDLEDAKRSRWRVRDMVELPLFRILSWCKKLV